MELKFITTPTGIIAKVISDECIIQELQDALDLMGDCSYHNAFAIMLRTGQLTPEFLDLKTGLAGEILQKFSTYKMKLAIIGDFSNIESKSLRDFIRESNKYGHISFVTSEDEAIQALI